MTDTQSNPESTPDDVPKSVHIPVSVLMNKQARDAGGWTTYEWLVGSVIPKAPDNEPRRGVVGRPLHDDDDAVYIWQGLTLDFYKDGGESYWDNLMSEAPRLFIVVEVDETDSTSTPSPSLVTASQDEAMAHMETDDMVHSVPMPASVIDALERFVVAHYTPIEKKKRKRKEWRDNSDFEKKRR